MKKTIKELNLMDDFLFQEVMRSQEFGIEFCEILIGTLLRRKVRISSVKTQEVISSVDTNLHGIRLDLFARERNEETVMEADEGTIYDLEMQVQKEKNLGKRVRYYQAVLDIKNLETGEGYENLPNLWTIIITPVDYFQRDRMVYTFESLCVEERDLSLEDGAVRLIIYTKGKIGSWKEAEQLLRYIEKSEAENVQNPDIRRIHKMVTKIKHDREAGVRYMRMLEKLERCRQEAIKEGWEEGREEGKKEGRKEGREEGREEGRQQVIKVLIKTYKEFGIPKEEAAAKLMMKFSVTKEKAEDYMKQYWE